MKRTGPGTKSYASLSEELRQAPESVGLLLESELSVLLSPLPCDTELATHLLGEGLTRLWLTGDRLAADLTDKLCRHAGPALWSRFQDVLEPTRQVAAKDVNWKSIRETDWTENDFQRETWTWTATRCRDYREADGLIAVVDGNRESLAIPFRLSHGEGEPGVVRDLSGKTIGTWSAALGHLHDCFPAGIPRVVLLCECGARAELLEGASLALAIVVAETRRDGRLADFDPLSVLCTGAFDAIGGLVSVQAIPAKQRLADNLGIRLLVCPGAGQDRSTVLAVPPGTPVSDCIALIAQRLDQLGMDRLTTHQANQRIRELKNEIHEGLLPLELAVRRLDRYESVFHGEPGSEYANEGMIYAAMLRGAIANHDGDPETGRGHLHRAAQLAQQSKNPLVQMHSLGNMIVSLTDLGLLDEAETTGRELLRWVETDFSGSTDEKTQARMVAAGALGGQPLLQKSLADPSLADESLCLLRQALENARQACLASEIARDAAQVALWYALLDPRNAAPQIETAWQEIRACGKDGDKSAQYLCSYRFLAAYRAILAHRAGHHHSGTNSVASTDNPAALFSGYENWPLPREEGWILGTALKYRGLLHAVADHANAANAAVADFERACDLLGPDNQVLIRFIGATAYLQAAESLKSLGMQAWKDYLNQARSEFEALRSVLYGIHRDPGWIERVGGLINGLPPSTLPNPQLVYRY